MINRLSSREMGIKYEKQDKREKKRRKEIKEKIIFCWLLEFHSFSLGNYLLTGLKPTNRLLKQQSDTEEEPFQHELSLDHP
jgi:hypothetical protein